MIWRNIELFYISGVLDRYLTMYENSGIEGIEDRLPGLINFLKGYYKDFTPEVDKEIFKKAMMIYYYKVGKGHRSEYALDQFTFARKDIDILADDIYGKSILTRGETSYQNPGGKIPKPSLRPWLETPHSCYGQSIQEASDDKVSPDYNRINDQIRVLNSKYMKAQMESVP